MNHRHYTPTNISYWLHGLIAGLVQGGINAVFLIALGLLIGASMSSLVAIFPVVGLLASANIVATGTTLFVYAILIDFAACMLGGFLGGVLFRIFTRGYGNKDKRPRHMRLKELNSFWHSTLPAGVRAVIAPTFWLVIVAAFLYAIFSGIFLALGMATAAPIVAYLIPFFVYILNGVFAGSHARHTWSLKP